MISFDILSQTGQIVQQTNAHTASESKSLERLSTGKRINRSSDDAAGTIQSVKLETSISSTDVAIRNIDEVSSILKTADGVLQKMTDLLDRARDIALRQGNEATYKVAFDRDWRIAYEEVFKIRNDLAKMGTDELHGIRLFMTEGLDNMMVKIDAQAGSGDTLNTGNFGPMGDGIGIHQGLGWWYSLSVGSPSLPTVDPYSGQVGTNTYNTLDVVIPHAMDNILEGRGKIGAWLNNLEHQKSFLTNQNIQHSQSLMRIQDTDFAFETAELARVQIKKQTSMAVLAQSNSSADLVMQLLRA